LRAILIPTHASAYYVFLLARERLYFAVLRACRERSPDPSPS
jgi:hypothetical protein